MTKETKELAVKQTAEVDFADRGTVAVLKQTVAVGATDSEFAMFAEFCKSTHLNPFKKEIWFIKVNGRVQMMTGINGYWSIANSHPLFDGAETGMISRQGEWVKTIGNDDFIGAWCRVYRKDRRVAMEGEALLKDYRKKSPLWDNSPRIMIKKVAQSIALRQAFSQELNGLYTEEEMPREYAAPLKSMIVEPTPQAARRIEHKIAYNFGDNALTEKQADFVLHNCDFDPVTGIHWAAKDFGAKLEKYRVNNSARAVVVEPTEEPSAESDDVLSWQEEADAAIEESERPDTKAAIEELKAKAIKARREA